MKRDMAPGECPTMGDPPTTTTLGAHYAGKVETIDAMETTVRAWSEAGQPEAGLCFASAIKYLMRPGKGQHKADMQKALDYLQRGMNHLEGRGGSWKR